MRSKTGRGAGEGDTGGTGGTTCPGPYSNSFLVGTLPHSSFSTFTSCYYFLLFICFFFFLSPSCPFLSFIHFSSFIFILLRPPQPPSSLRYAVVLVVIVIVYLVCSLPRLILNLNEWLLQVMDIILVIKIFIIIMFCMALSWVVMPNICTFFIRY